MAVMCLRPIKRNSEFWPCSVSLFWGTAELIFLLCAPLQHCANMWGQTSPRQPLSCRTGASPVLLAGLVGAQGLAWSTTWSCSPCLLSHSQHWKFCVVPGWSIFSPLCTPQCMSARAPAQACTEPQQTCQPPCKLQNVHISFPSWRHKHLLITGVSCALHFHVRYTTDFSQV